MPTPALKLVPMEFPMKGLQEDAAETAQPDGTTGDCQNVRGYDLVAKRDRGCQRVGVAKFVADRMDTVPIDMIVVGIIDGHFSPVGPEPDDSFSYSFQQSLYQPFNEGGSDFNVLTTDNPADPATYLSSSDPLVGNFITSDLGGGDWGIDFDMGNNSPNSSKDVQVSAGGQSFFVHYPGLIFRSFSVSSGTFGNTYSGAATSLPVTLNSPQVLNITQASSSGVNIGGAALATDNSMDSSNLNVSSNRQIIFNGVGPPASPTPYVNVVIGAVSSHAFTFSVTFQINSGVPGTYTATVTMQGITLNFSCTQ